jgi:Predicted Zn-dependent protease (DUF2268)
MIRHLLTTLFLVLAASLSAQNTTKIFTSDIDNFWIAYDSVQTTKDTTRQVQFIQALYLDKATDGLKDFMVSRELSAKRYLKNIERRPKFWVSVRPYTLKIQSYTPDVDKIMLRFKELYPDFKQPGVYFTIGCLSSGGTTTTDKILIGTEIAASDSTVDASELGSWLQGVFKTNKNVVYLVSHEVVHTQQKNSDSENEENFNLLSYCLHEGAADFVSELLLRQPVVSPYMTYGKANEKKVWQDFEKEMNGREIKNWLYNASDAPGGNADLGYFIGYVICKSFYEKAKDKNQALKDIIEMDFKKESVLKFLEKSKYTDKWK